MSEDYEDTPKTEYNLNASKSGLIGQQQSLGAYHYTSMNYISCYQCWKTIRLLISNRLTDKQLTHCKLGEKLILTRGGIANNGKFIRNATFVLILDKYIETVSIYLRKVGLDIADKGEEDLF